MPEDPIATLMTGFVSNMNAIAPHNVLPRMMASAPPFPPLPGMPKQPAAAAPGNAAAKGGIQLPTSEDYTKHIEGSTLGAVKGTTIFF